METSFFPLYIMGAFCCHGNQNFDLICPKTLCSLSPTPVMLHIKFDLGWPAGFRDIQVWKCGWRRRTDDGPLLYYKLTLWAFGSGELINEVHWTCSNGPRQANMVLIAYASSEGSGETAHPRSLARTFAARSYKQWINRNLQTERSLYLLNGWTCAVEICYDGMLEDTNSLDGAQIMYPRNTQKAWQYSSMTVLTTAVFAAVLIRIKSFMYVFLSTLGYPEIVFLQETHFYCVLNNTQEYLWVLLWSTQDLLEYIHKMSTQYLLEYFSS